MKGRKREKGRWVRGGCGCVCGGGGGIPHIVSNQTKRKSHILSKLLNNVTPSTNKNREAFYDDNNIIVTPVPN